MTSSWKKNQSSELMSFIIPYNFFCPNKKLNHIFSITLVQIQITDNFCDPSSTLSFNINHVLQTLGFRSFIKDWAPVKFIGCEDNFACLA